MAVPVRAVGLVCGDSCVQLEPFHTHVSFKTLLFAPTIPIPPNRRTWPWADSFAIAKRYRADGLVCGAFFVQLEPSHTQVSPRKFPLASPPNKTTWRCAESYAIPWAARAGGLVCGDFWVQLEPSHTHVSPKVSGYVPPAARSDVPDGGFAPPNRRSEEHTSELQSLRHLVC